MGAAVRMMGVALALLAIVALFLALVYFGQTRLIFFPQPLRAAPPPSAEVEDIELATTDGGRLHGWLAKAGTGRRPLLIYFGGNAEEVSWLLPLRRRLPGWSLLLVNYRGYGRSEGSPGEKALFADALALYDYAAARPDVDARSIALMGRSLGTGVAVHVAAQRDAQGVILVSPYDSLLALARVHYPFLPAGLLRHRFESLSIAPQIHAPLLCLVAGRDGIVPPEHSRRLFEAWAGPREWVAFPGADHVSISDEPDYWTRISEFLTEVHVGSRPRQGADEN